MRFLIMLLFFALAQARAFAQFDIHKIAEANRGWLFFTKVALNLAGAHNNSTFRARLLRGIYLDSGKNHTFAYIASYGADWGKTIYDHDNAYVSGRNGEAVDILAKAVGLKICNGDLFDARVNQELLKDFMEINRAVFVDAYRYYYFTKFYGNNPYAAEVMGLNKTITGKNLFSYLLNIHQHARNGTRMNEVELIDFYKTHFNHEQNTLAAPSFEKFNKTYLCGSFGKVVKKLFAVTVHFSYFPKGTDIKFKNFTDFMERIVKGDEAYLIARNVGILDSNYLLSTKDYYNLTIFSQNDEATITQIVSREDWLTLEPYSRYNPIDDIGY